MGWRQAEYCLCCHGLWVCSGLSSSSVGVWLRATLWARGSDVEGFLHSFWEASVSAPKCLPGCFLSCCPAGPGAPALQYLLNPCWGTEIVRYLLLGMGLWLPLYLLNCSLLHKCVCGLSLKRQKSKSHRIGSIFLFPLKYEYLCLMRLTCKIPFSNRLWQLLLTLLFYLQIKKKNA